MPASVAKSKAMKLLPETFVLFSVPTLNTEDVGVVSFQYLESSAVAASSSQIKKSVLSP